MDLQSLIDRFLESPELLSDDDVAALVAALQGSPADAVGLREQLVVAELLAQKLSPERQDFPAQIEQRVCDFERGEEEIVRQISAMRELAIEEFRQARPAGHSAWRILAIALGLLVAVGIGAFLLRPTTSPVAAVVEFDGAVMLVRAGTESPLTTRIDLHSGDRLTTAPDGRIKLRYGDGTWVYVFEDTTIRLDGPAAGNVGHGKQVEIDRGRLTSAIVPQPAGRPMLFVSPTATAKVLGTEIWLAVDKQSTELQVTEGKVEFTRTGAPQSVVVEPGKVGLASLSDVELKAPLWPAERNSLVFAFSSSQEPAVVRDGSTGVLHSVRLAAQGEASYNSRGGMVFRGGTFVPEDDAVATHIAAACQKTQQLTVELCLRTDGSGDSAPREVISYGSGSSRAFALAQQKEALIWRLKTQTQVHTATVAKILPRQTVHLMIACKEGTMACYLDGAKVFEEAAAGGDFSSWTDCLLTFGGQGAQAWLGTIEGAAIYNRFFTEEDARRSAESFQSEHLASPAEDRWQDLLALVDPARHAVAGKWLRDADSLRCDPSAPGKISLPLAPDGDFQLQVEFSRVSGDEPLGLIVPVGQSLTLLVLDGRSEAGESYCGLDQIDGQPAADNPSTTPLAAPLENGRRYKLELTVNRAGPRSHVRALVDDQPLLFWSGQTRSLSLNPQYEIPDRRFPALVSSSGELRFHAVRLKMLTGQARD